MLSPFQVLLSGDALSGDGCGFSVKDLELGFQSSRFRVHVGPGLAFLGFRVQTNIQGCRSGLFDQKQLSAGVVGGFRRPSKINFCGNRKRTPGKNVLEAFESRFGSRSKGRSRVASRWHFPGPESS